MNHDMENLNLAELDVESLEQRLEMSLFLHPMLWDCGSKTDSCTGHVTVAATE